MSKILYFFQVLLLTYILFGLWLYIDQRNHVYHPNTSPVLASQLPGFTAKSIITEDGVPLKAWYHPGNPMLVYFQGNSGNAAERYVNVKPFMDNGWGVLLAPYRGFGGNPGTPTEENLYRDAEASLKLLNGSHTSCTVVLGRSLGSGVATFVARKYNAAALVLISPFTSIPDVAQGYYPIYPVKWLSHDHFDSYSRINLVNMPLLVMHGTSDTVVPYALGVRLYQKALQPKKLITLNNLNHNDIPDDQIAGAVIKFTKPFLSNCLTSNK